MMMSAPRVSKCCADFCQALAFPESAPLVGIPQAIPVIPTVKWRVKAMANAIAQANGTAFVVVNPQGFCAADAVGMWVSDGTGSGTVLPGSTTGCLSVYSNSPYYAGTIEGYRVVGLKIRIQYTGSTLDKSGAIYMVEEPRHYPVAGFSPTAIMQNQGSCAALDFSVKSLLWTGPAAADESSLRAAGGTIAYAPMGVLISGAKAAAPFMVMVDAMYEGTLTNNMQLATTSFADMQGGSLVSQAFKYAQNAATGGIKEILSVFAKEFATTTRQAAGGLLTAGATTLAQRLTSSSRYASGSMPLIEEVLEGGALVAL